MKISLLNEEMSIYLKEWKTNPDATEAQRKIWPQGRKLPKYLLGYDSENCLRLLEEDGFDGQPVGSLKASAAMNYFSHNEECIWPPDRDLIRLSLFFQLSLYEALILVLKGQWEMHFAILMDCKKKKGNDLFDILKNNTKKAMDYSLNFNPGLNGTADTALLFQIFEEHNNFASNAGYNEGNLQFTNYAFAALHGYTAKELLGKHLSIFHTDDQMPSIEEANRQIKDTGEFIGEIWHTRRDGTVFPARTYNSLLNDDNGNSIGMIAAIRDITEYKRTEESLRESEKKWRSAIENAPILITIIDRSGTIKFINHTISGISVKEVIGKKVYDYISLEHIGAVKNTLEQVFQTGKPLKYEVRGTDSIGRDLWFATQAGPIKFDEQTSALMLVTTDITEHKKMEDMIQQSEEKYRNVVELTNVGICIIQDGILKYVNPQIAFMSGYSIEEPINKHFSEFIYPDELQKAIEKYRLHISGKEKTQRYESAILGKDKTRIEIELSASLILYEQKEASLVFVNDITESNRAKKRIEYLNELLRAVRDIDKIINIEKNHEGLIKGACDCLIEIHRHSKIWIVLIDESMKYITAAHAGMDKDFTQLIEMFKSGSLFPCTQSLICDRDSDVVVFDESTLICKDCPFECKNKNIQSALVRLGYNNKLYGILAVELHSDFVIIDEEKLLLKKLADDISFALHSIEVEEERRKLEAQLVYTERLFAVGQRIAGVAYEFSNILAVIVGYAQLSLDDNPAGEIKESLQEIEKIAGRGCGLLTKLGKSTGFRNPEFITQNITDCLDEVIKFNRRKSWLENIKIERNYISHSKVSFDRGQSEQVFLNLMITAAHAIRYRGTGSISITVRDVIDYVEILFSDTGIGMDASARMTIFDPFFSARSDFANGGWVLPGARMGLFITYMIIERHGGTIAVESEKEKGATFTIRFPIIESEFAGEQKAEPKTFGADIKEIKDMIVLIVAYEEEMVKLMSLILRRARVGNILTEGNGKEAINIFKSHNPDLVFLDLLMPDMNGEEIFDEMKSINRETPIVFMSGPMDIMDIKVNNLKEKGSFDFIYKPFIINDVIDLHHRVVNMEQDGAQ